MAPAHRVHGRGDARARGGRARARARRAARGGGGRRALQRHATFSNVLMVIQVWRGRTPSSMTSKEVMTSAHHACGDVRARGARARARARRAALGGGGCALQSSASLIDPQQ